MDATAFRLATEEIGLQLTTVQVEAFTTFENRLYEANKVMNLTRVPRNECWLRHFIDSLLFHDLVPKGAAVLDIGTGPGFPAWPLACVRPDLMITALDSTAKVLDFLRQNALPNLAVIQERAEGWGVRDRFDVVTGRALAPLAIQLELSAASCKLNGKVIPMRTASDRVTVKNFVGTGLGLKLVQFHERKLPGTGAVRLFPVYEKVRATESLHPRPWAEMKRAPMR